MLNGIDPFRLSNIQAVDESLSAVHPKVHRLYKRVGRGERGV